jgi:hypothetical protein
MRRGLGSLFAVLAAAALAAGCPDRSISEVDPQQGRVAPKDLTVKVNRDLDLLFLIDNSPSMADKQANLIANFPTFIKVLGQIEGGLPNVHIGVVTSDLGTRSAADGKPGTDVGTGRGKCQGVGDDGQLQITGVTTQGEPYLIDTRPDDDPATPRTTNFDGTSDDALTAAFAKIALVGAEGCGFEQHLEAIKRALDPGNAANTGFLRKDALLAVVIIADEDDCSMEHSSLLAPDTAAPGLPQSFRCTKYGVLCDQGGTTPDQMASPGAKSQCHPNDASPYLTNVAQYADFLKQLKGDGHKVVVAGIMGPTDPFGVELADPSKPAFPSLVHSCKYVGGDMKNEVADPAIRIKAFLDQFPGQNTFATICQRDLSGPLGQIAELIKAASNDPCIEGKLADPPNYECSVSAVTAQNTADQTEQVLPRCDATASNPPCWHIVADEARCSAPEFGHLLLQIEGQALLNTDTHVLANCVTE